MVEVDSIIIGVLYGLAYVVSITFTFRWIKLLIFKIREYVWLYAVIVVYCVHFDEIIVVVY